MVWPGRPFERGFWDCSEGHLMEMEMLDVRDFPSDASVDDGMWEDDVGEEDKPSREKPSRVMLAWQRTKWACTKITKVVLGFRWDGKWIEGVLTEKARQWEEEAREEERREMGPRWVDVDGDQLMDIGDEIADALSESESDDDEDYLEETKALKVRHSVSRIMRLDFDFSRHRLVDVTSGVFFSNCNPRVNKLRCPSSLVITVSLYSTHRYCSRTAAACARLYYSRLGHQHSSLFTSHSYITGREPTLNGCRSPPHHRGTRWTCV